jgi:hypothetical protein
MANQVQVPLNVGLQADGTSTTWSFDLLTYPYTVDAGDATGSFSGVFNWFSESTRCKAPDGVSAGSGDIGGFGGTFTVALSGTVVTLTFSEAPAAGGYSVGIYLLFT